MPCTQTGSLEGDAALAAREGLKKCSEKNTRLTQLLCMAMTYILGGCGKKPAVNPPKELQEWWSEHQKIDRDRRVRERRIDEEKRGRELALTKLTEKERKLLGVR